MNIPTAEEFIKQNKNLNYSTIKGSNPHLSVLPFIEADLIEFAKLHVKAALQTASEEAIAKEDPKDYGTGKIWVDEKSILTAYPLTNIE